MAKDSFFGKVADWFTTDKANAEITQEKAYSYSSASTVSSLLGHTKKGARTREECYRIWGQMESDPICSTALGLLVTAALGGHETTGEIVFIEDNPKIKSSSKENAMVEEVRDYLQPILNKVAFSISYKAAAFGDAYARMYYDKDGIQNVVVDDLLLPPLVLPYEKGGMTVGYGVFIGDRQFQSLNALQVARMKMPRTANVPQVGIMEKARHVKVLLEDDLTNLPAIPSAAGGSLLFPAEESYSNLSAALLALVGSRWKDSIDESIITINLDGMAKEQSDTFIKSIISILERSKSLAEKAIKENKPQLQKLMHVLPVSGEKQLTSIAPFSTQNNNSVNVDDVMLHARMLSGALGVDLSMIGFADQMSGGLGDGGFFRMSAQAAQRAMHIRNALNDFCNDVIKTHVLKKYGTYYHSNVPWIVNFAGTISALESEQQKTRSEKMNSSALMLQCFDMIKNLGADENSIEDILEKQMGIDSDQAKLYAKMIAGAAEKAEEGGDEQGGFGSKKGFG